MLPVSRSNGIRNPCDPDICTVQHDRPESVGLVEKADHGEEHGPHVLGGVPPLTGQLTGLGVIHRGVQDRDAQVTVLGAETFGCQTWNKPGPGAAVLWSRSRPFRPETEP